MPPQRVTGAGSLGDSPVSPPRGVRSTGGEALSQVSGWAIPALPEEELGPGVEGALPEAGESAEGEAGAVWAGGEEPAQQLCVSRASIPSGSAALTHPAAPSLPRGDPWGPGAALAHGGHCEPPQPHTGTPRVPRVKSPPMLCVLTGEMPVAFPARPQRGSEVPWGRAGPAVPPHRAPEQGWAGREEEAGGGRGRAALTRAGSGFGSGCPPLRQMPPPSLCWWLSPLL